MKTFSRVWFQTKGFGAAGFVGHVSNVPSLPGTLETCPTQTGTWFGTTPSHATESRPKTIPFRDLHHARMDDPSPVERAKPQATQDSTLCNRPFDVSATS